MHDPTAEKNASAELTDVPNRCARGGVRPARPLRSRPYIQVESATAAWISYLSSTNQRHRILESHRQAVRPKGMQRRPARISCWWPRPVSTIDFGSDTHRPAQTAPPVGAANPSQTRVSFRLLPVLPPGRAGRTQHTLSLPASFAPVQTCTDSPAPCIHEASACRAAAPSHAGLPRNRSDAAGG